MLQWASASLLLSPALKKHAKHRFVETLRSDWLILTSLLRDLQLLLVVADRLIVSTQGLHCIADIGVRTALTGNVTWGRNEL